MSTVGEGGRRGGGEERECVCVRARERDKDMTECVSISVCECERESVWPSGCVCVVGERQES
jgi:hypothetical protein